MMKARPSAAVSSLPLWKLYIFPLIIAPAVPSTAPPALLILAAHGRRGSLPFSSLGLFFPLCLRCTKPAGGGRGEGRGEAMESWMVWGGGTPRFHVCSSRVVGGGGAVWNGLELIGHCKGTPITFSWTHRFWQDQGLERLGLGWSTVGRLRHGKERTLSSRGIFPKYRLLVWGSPHVSEYI